MHNIEEAREVLKKFSNNQYTVISAFKAFDNENDIQRKREVVLSKIHTQISLHSKGENVYEANLELYGVTDVDSTATANYNGVSRSELLRALSIGLSRGEINADMASVLTKHLMDD